MSELAIQISACVPGRARSVQAFVVGVSGGMTIASLPMSVVPFLVIESCSANVPASTMIFLSLEALSRAA